MNELIKNIFTNFEVDGVPIPVKFLYYYGHGEPYVIYQKESLASGLLADDGLQNYVEYYDFDVYSTGNYKNIVESVKNKLTQNNFLWDRLLPHNIKFFIFERRIKKWQKLV